MPASRDVLSAETDDGMWIPRRKVPARVDLADGTSLRGELYVSRDRADGAPGALAERLGDSSEAYLPFAHAGRHVFLNKAGVVCVHVDRAELSLPPEGKGTDFRVRLFLSTGESLEGTIRSHRSDPAPRTLDAFNRAAAGFLPLVTAERDRTAVLISGRHVAWAEEVVEIETLVQ